MHRITTSTSRFKARGSAKEIRSFGKRQHRHLEESKSVTHHLDVVKVGAWDTQTSYRDT